MTEESEEEKKLARAVSVVPRNRLKEKVGSGGFDEAVLVKAQTLLKENKIDFEPTAQIFVNLLGKKIAEAKSGSAVGEAAIEALLYPLMQLKSQGSLFQYHFITSISDNLITFLEKVSVIDTDVLDIAAAHQTALHIVLATKIKGGDSKAGKDLHHALVDSCNRYYRAKNI